MIRAVLLAAALAAPAAAEVPTVATDIGPVHSLAAQVMQGVGAPGLLLPPGASPHNHSMKPSEAALLSRADVVFWIGHDLTPWLGAAVAQLAGGAVTVELGTVPGTRRLEFREGAAFGGHDHADEGHEEEIDPHLWLDPANGRVWLGAIAEALAATDPDNAASYRANATEAAAALDRLEAEIAATLAPARGTPFAVFHDAYHYFEARFGIEAVAAIALGDATAPGPRRLAEVRETIRDTGAVCVFVEPGADTGMIDAVTEGSGARVAVLDPAGQAIEPGPELYPALLRALADGLASCLSRK